MKIHEYQARKLLADAGIPVPPAEVAFTPDQAAGAFKKIGLPVAVVKAQVYAGGRGKAGFVKLVRSADEALDAAKYMLTHRMVSPQTGPEGVPVNALLVAGGVDIAKEYYLGMTVDRTRNTATMIASAEGGVEIEEVARRAPEKVLKTPLHPLLGLQAYQARQIAYALGFRETLANAAVKIMQALAKVFAQYDASLAEINPLVLTRQGLLLAIDAKVSFDDNALFRHPEYESYYDAAEEDPQEVEAAKHELSYVKLDGNIGCMVNGAGLAMATMDIIKFYGEEPANFLDVGGGANKEKVTAAFKIITADPAVKGILVNIFGGIMKCDVIAEGVLAAVRDTGLEVPLVVRLEGTNVELGKKIIAESGLRVIAADSMSDAAEKIVAAVRGV